MLLVNQLVGFGVGGRASGPLTYVGGTAAGSISNGGTISLTSLTGGVDTQPRADDLVIIGFAPFSSASNLDISISTPSGYNELLDLYSNGSSDDVNFGVYYKFQTSTPDTSITLSGSSFNYAVVFVFRYADATTPIEASASASATTATLADPPSVTTLSANCYVVCMAATARSTGGTPVAPTGYSGLQLDSTNIFGALKTVATPAAENPAGFTGYTMTTGGGWIAVTLAVKPM